MSLDRAKGVFNNGLSSSVQLLANPDLSTSIIARLTRHFLLATAVTAFASGLISYWLKISIHMVAMGGLLGLLLMLVKAHSFDSLIIIVLLLLLPDL